MEDRLIEIFRIAIKDHASDIHLTLKDDTVIIELRIGQRLKRIKATQTDLRLIRYLQYISKLDVGNNLAPQTGQFEIEIDDYKYAVRFAYMHDMNITNGVIRILNLNTDIRLEKLNINQIENKYFEELINMQDGLIVFSGPTGSGKTTTLYTILDNIKNKKIITIEDPIEIFKDNYLQIQLNEHINWDYSQALKQVLRHDPDVIMIGEIRDEKAAKAAIRAANTGHLVLTSIHAQSAEIAINRLLDLEVDRDNLKMVLRQVYNQRLFFRYHNHQEKVGVYEIMENKEIRNYLEGRENATRNITLNEKIKIALKQRQIEITN